MPAHGETNLARLLSNLTPSLHPGDYVYCLVPDLLAVEPDEIIGFFRETEGTTVIVSKETADRRGLHYTFVAAWITLMAHSSLEGTGLTAAFASALAGANIGCNVVAAYFHDHLFVAKSDGERALDVLKKLSENVG
jgi:hypothetical protein